MKRLILLFAIILSLSIDDNCHAQVKTKFGDNVSSLDGIMKAYYDVVTVKKGEKPSYDRDSLLHFGNVQVGWAVKGKNGKMSFKYVSLKEFHGLTDGDLAASGFYEREISRKVQKFGAIYHVWSTYETRHTKTGPMVERGINSIELFYDGARFWILGWFFDAERKDNPIPAAYLTRQAE
ncbi:MAG TPA: hypothetical protein VFE53_22255 [Mucilaginibacter sp.]|jgi:hypothetical protein|nr:hypothetical protein [Mucilaginibacter sp.]